MSETVRILGSGSLAMVNSLLDRIEELEQENRLLRELLAEAGNRAERKTAAIGLNFGVQTIQGVCAGEVSPEPAEASKNGDFHNAFGAAYWNRDK